MTEQNPVAAAPVQERPALQHRTSRGLAKYFFLGILTLGIYPIVVESHISEELNTVASKYDGKRTMHYCLIYFLLNWCTLGIATLVWYHRTSARMGDELHRNTRKQIRDGHILILRAGKTYIVTGQELNL